MASPTVARARKRRRRLIRRVLVGGAVATPVLVLALWIAVNRVEWLGPLVADSLRAVIGVEAVTKLEDFAYGIQDRVNRAMRSGEAPKAYWEVPEKKPATKAKVKKKADAKEEEPKLPPFAPKDVGPALETWSAPGDGEWVPIVDPKHPDRDPHMMKTLLHPDKSRSWAEVFVVAIDLRRSDIQLVPGSREPKATEEDALEMDRPGVIPEKDREIAMAAFNGGFKTEHGRYGMRMGDLTIVKPRTGVCAIAKYKDDSMKVAPWDSLVESEKDMVWWRQTPNCMVDNHDLHPRLKSERLAKKWGATLDGETVIRRSAIGINEDGTILFTSISNHTTAKTIAEGVHHAGAVTVAQMDVNFSYPKFVTFEPKTDLEEDEKPKRIAVALAEGFEFSEDEYIRKEAYRDFFYVMPKDPDRRTARNGAN